MIIKLKQPKPPVNIAVWHRWFAWRPVIIDNHFVWLETVEREIDCWNHGTLIPTVSYRLIGSGQ